MSANNLINVAEFVPSTASEGPGLRFALWVQGCPLRCPYCCNPEMLSFDKHNWVLVTDLVDMIVQTKGIEGVTFLGGEPFAQAAGLALLAQKLKSYQLSIMVFTGFTKSYIEKQNRADWQAFMQQIDILVDGPYVQKQQTNSIRWVGSSNQKVYFLTNRYSHIKQQFNNGDCGANSVELRLSEREILVNGFPSIKLQNWLNQVKASQIKIASDLD